MELFVFSYQEVSNYKLFEIPALIFFPLRNDITLMILYYANKNLMIFEMLFDLTIAKSQNAFNYKKRENGRRLEKIHSEIC